MRMHLRGPRTEWTEALRQHVARRLHFALSRFSQSITSVTVDIGSAARIPDNSPRTCRLTVHLAPKSKLVLVEESQGDLYAPLSLLAEQAGRAVERSLDRERSFRPHSR